MSQHTELRGKLQRMAIECGARLRGDDWCFDDGALENFYRFSRAADALQALERVPMTEEVALKIAHRRATTYTHRSDPHYSGYAFVPYTLMDFVRDLESHHDITPPESK